MPLPRPGKVNPVPEAAVAVQETLPELQQLEMDEAPQLGNPPLEAEPQVSQVFQQQPAGTPPFESGDNLPPEMTLVDPAAEAPVHHAEAAATPAELQSHTMQVPAEMPQNLPQTRPATAQAVAPVATPQDHRTLMGAGGQQRLAEMGFEGLEGGFGDFPTIKLQEGQFQTSEGDMLGTTFACVIHSSEAKWIMKSGPGDDAEFKYTKDKQYDSSGTPLESTINVWKAQGILVGEPIFKAYADVTAQLFDVNDKTLGGVVVLSIPETSIGRTRGYLKTLAIAEGLHPSEVITQVYMAPKVTSVKYPFHPWGMRKWALVSQFGL